MDDAASDPSPFIKRPRNVVIVSVESFRIDNKTYEATPTAVNPQLLREAIAYYQTASRAFKGGSLKFYRGR